MKIRNIVLGILIAGVLAGACASSHGHKNKKLKPGKPIPCPLKDC